MIRVLDSVSSVDPAAAKARGYTAIMRYLVGNNPLSHSECGTYTAANFGIGSLFELNPDAVALGEAQGIRDASLAVPAARALHQPKQTAIYFSADVDPAGIPGGPAGGVAYFRGASLLTRSEGYLMGCYGGAALANACLQAHVIDRVMMPNASSWADGQTSRHDIIQGYPYVVIAGASYDPDLANPDTAGLWNLDGPWPKHSQPTGGQDVKVAQISLGEDSKLVAWVQDGLQRVRAADGTAYYPLSGAENGHYGPVTDAAIRRFQHDHNCVPGLNESHFGPDSWQALADALRQ